MSKTAQRKRQAYKEGLEDGRLGRGERWARHPYMAHYRRGYREAQRERLERQQRRTWWFRVTRWLCRKLEAA